MERPVGPICLDTATLSKELTLKEKVKLTADAGFDAIEPWDRELLKHEESGGSLGLGKEIRDFPVSYGWKFSTRKSTRTGSGCK